MVLIKDNVLNIFIRINCLYNIYLNMDNNETLSETEIEISEYMITILTFGWFIAVIICIFTKYYCCINYRDKCIMCIESNKLNKYVIQENVNDICPICIEDLGKEKIVKLDCIHSIIETDSSKKDYESDFVKLNNGVNYII